MSGPSLLLDTLAGIVLVTSAYCFSRLLAARRWRRSMHYDVNLAHVAMGVAMAGMFVTSFQTLPTGAWEVLFGCLTLWFALQIGSFVRGHGLSGWSGDEGHHVSHYATHFVMALAMLYTFLVVGAPPASSASRPLTTGAAGGSAGQMSGMGGRSGLPFVLLIVLLISAVWHADGLGRFSRGWRRQLAGSTAAVSGALMTASVGAGDAPAVGAGAVPEGAAEERTARPGPVASTGLPGPAPYRPVDPLVLSSSDGRWLAPRLEIGCHIAMCITMAYMLVTLR